MVWAGPWCGRGYGMGGAMVWVGLRCVGGTVRVGPWCKLGYGVGYGVGGLWPGRGYSMKGTVMWAGLIL